MEMHMVHKNMNKNDKQNENLVIGVIFDYKDDIHNTFLEEMNLSTEKKIEDALITNIINKDDEFYYYKGSLTTVPCTENVNWIVFKNIKSMSFNQFNKFKNWVENSDLKYYGRGYGNARGPKRLNGRKVYLENYHFTESSFWTYLLVIFPVVTFLLFPINIFYYHLYIKSKVEL